MFAKNKLIQFQTRIFSKHTDRLSVFAFDIDYEDGH